MIDGVEYIAIGPADAEFMLEEPGNADHIMWATMADNAPQVGTVALKGNFDRKGLDPSMLVPTTEHLTPREVGIKS